MPRRPEACTPTAAALGRVCTEGRQRTPAADYRIARAHLQGQPSCCVTTMAACLHSPGQEHCGSQPRALQPQVLAMQSTEQTQDSPDAQRVPELELLQDAGLGALPGRQQLGGARGGGRTCAWGSAAGIPLSL